MGAVLLVLVLVLIDATTDKNPTQGDHLDRKNKAWAQYVEADGGLK